MNAAPNAKRMKSTNAPVPAHVAAIAESQRQHWSQAQGYVPGAKTISATLDCGHVKPFSAAIYAEYPQMIGCSRIICTAGKVRIMTTADVDVMIVEAFICEYADLVAENIRSQRESHTFWMDADHLREKYYRATVRRQRSVQQQANRLRIGR